MLEGSAAAAYVREQYPSLELRPYDGNTNAMSQVRSGVDIATLQDWPIAIFYDYVSRDNFTLSYNCKLG